MTGRHMEVMLPSIIVTLILIMVTVISVFIVKKKKAKQRFDFKNQEENNEEIQRLNHLDVSDVSIKV